MRKLENKFIYFGDIKFDINKWEDVIDTHWIKPIGGLWASRKHVPYGWFQWNASNHYMDCSSYNCFEFSLKPEARILTIKSVEDLEALPKHEPEKCFQLLRVFETVYLDFNKLKEDYDAIEVFVSSDRRLYRALYGWDCDSILIMNKDVIDYA